MPISQSQAIEAVRFRLDEEAPGLFRDDQIRAWLNEGVREVARRSEWFRATQNASVSVGTQTYVLAGDTIRVYRVEYQPSGTNLKYPLEYRDLNQMDVVWGIMQSVSQGVPMFWSMWAANPPTVYLSPIPSQAGQINVFYYRMPADLATTNTDDSRTSLEIPMGWEDLPVEYATALGFRKSRNPQMYALTMQEFQSKLGEFVEMSTRYTDAPTMIVPDSGGWQFGTWGQWEY
jgi:hypothetical protein